MQVSDHRHASLLRSCRQRPRGRRNSDQGDELAPLHAYPKWPFESGRNIACRGSEYVTYFTPRIRSLPRERRAQQVDGAFRRTEHALGERVELFARHEMRLLLGLLGIGHKIRV